MQLTHNQKLHFIENGYVKIPGVVPRFMINAAMKAVNNSIGKGIPEGHHRSNYCRELGDQPVITDLFNKTPAKELLESLVGADKFHPIKGAQIALRFPDYQDPPNPRAGAHLDGVLQVKDGIMQNFTALVGILLSDQPEPNMGNFIVYPGSHYLYEQYFREKGPDVLLTEEDFQTKHRSLNVPLPDPVQITGQAGDLVISHFQAIHAGGPNTSHQIRYSCYYRIDHVERYGNWRAPLTDIWMHYPGLHDLLQQR